MKTRLLPTLLWLLLTLAAAYLVDTWLSGASARMLQNRTFVFVDVLISVLGRLLTAISLLLLYRHLTEGEGKPLASGAILLVGVIFMVYPSLVFLMQMNGVITETPAFYFAPTSLTGVSATLAAGIGILTLARDG